MIRGGAWALLAAALGTASFGAAEEPAQPAADTEFAQAFRAAQAVDARVHSIGWRLKAGNAQQCAAPEQETERDTGLLLQDSRLYTAHGSLRRQLSLSSDIFVQAVAAGSPAAEQGIEPGRSVLAVAGHRIADLPWSDAQPWMRQSTVQTLLQPPAGHDRVMVQFDAMPEPSALPTALPTALRTVAVCATRFEVVSGGDSMGADGQRVRIGGEFPGFAYPDDELAAAMAHELAHNILRHPQWLAAHGRKRRDVRASEREADRLMPWLLANADYDPAAAVRFMRRWGPHHNGGLFRKRTHDGWDERVDVIAAQLPLIAHATRADGQADWSKHFAPRKLDSKYANSR